MLHVHVHVTCACATCACTCAHANVTCTCECVRACFWGPGVNPPSGRRGCGMRCKRVCLGCKRHALQGGVHEHSSAVPLRSYEHNRVVAKGRTQRGSSTRTNDAQNRRRSESVGTERETHHIAAVEYNGQKQKKDPLGIFAPRVRAE